jgi:hypothetical protein
VWRLWVSFARRLIQEGPHSSVRPNDQKADNKTQGRDTGQNVKNFRLVSISHAAKGSKAIAVLRFFCPS